MKADVAIVGGGPAGAATALLLAREGFEVSLFDRAYFPRPKPCGEFLNPGAVRILRSELRVEIPSEAEPVTGIMLVPDQGAPLKVLLIDAHGNHETGYSLRRTTTDRHLLSAAEAAGAQVFQGYEVQSAEDGVYGRDPDGAPFACRSRLVIAADGSHSRIARQRGLVRPIPRLQRIGLTVHFADVSSFEDQAVLMYGARTASAGIAGFSPQSGGRAVLSCVLPKSFGIQIAQDRQAFVRRFISGLPGLENLDNARIEAVQTTACFGHRLTRPWDDEILFVGDAARFVDPFTGEGVHHALEGALAAAATASAHLRNGRPLAQYVELRKGLERRYLVCDLVQALVNRPSLLNLIVANLRRRNRSAERLISEIVDLAPPGSLFTPRLIADALLPSLS